MNKFLGIEYRNKILDSSKGLKDHLTGNMSAVLLAYLKQEAVISDWDYEFYLNTIQKGTMSEKQRDIENILIESGLILVVARLHLH